MTPWCSTSRGIRRGRARHHDDLAADRHHRETQHTRRVGQRRHREVDRASALRSPSGGGGVGAEGVAHERQGGHRLDVAVGELHALGPPRGAPGADDHDGVVRRGVREVVLGISPAAEPASSVEADEDGSPGVRDLRVRACVEQADAVEQDEQLRFSAELRGSMGHHTAPRRAMPKTRERAGVVAGQDPTLSPAGDARARERPGDRATRSWTSP